MDPTPHTTTIYPSSDEYVASGSQSTTQSSTSTFIGTKSAQHKTSVCWDYFEEEIAMEDGVNMLKAWCKRCGHKLSTRVRGVGGKAELATSTGRSSSTSTRTRILRGQTTLKFNTDGIVQNFVYDHALHREGICRLIASSDFPLGIGDFPGYIKYI